MTLDRMIDHRAPVLLARRLDGAPPGVAEAVFRDLSLELEPGTWLAVTGPNGSGKTTLALTLAGLWGARAGTIELGARRGSAARVVTILQEPASVVPRTKLALVNRSVLAACDALDGVTDGLLTDPNQCRFDPASLLCRGVDRTIASRRHR